MAKKFTRRCTNYYLRLGSKQKNKQRWRNERGIHSKIRKRHKGRPTKVQIGFGTDKKNKYLIKEKLPVLINNLKELNKVDGKKEAIIIARIGQKKREEIIKEADKKGIKILNTKKKNESKK